jgi:hypothetical protein
MNINISKTNKLLLILVIALVAVLVVLYGWQKTSAPPTYHAVYLQTGELYFGKLVKFPSFGLKEVYLFQTNPQNTETPVSIQKFTNIFWGPADFLKINRDKVVWITKLDPNGRLVQLIKTNPNLTPAAAPPALPLSQ